MAFEVKAVSSVNNGGVYAGQFAFLFYILF